LDAIEASLSEMKELLKSHLLSNDRSLTRDPANEPRGTSSSLNPRKDINSQATMHVPSATDISATTDIQPAPITVVRHVGSLITEPVTTGENDSLRGNMTEMGLDSDNFASVFQHGFEQIASWYPFPHETLTDLKENHPLLFAMCLLAGIRATAGLNRTNLHVTLHTLVKTHLGRKTLDTPIDISTIHGMLIFSAWSFGPLVPGGRYIDSWLMSSTTITHCMLSFPLSELVSLVGLYDETSRNMCRMWIQASLVHLKYAIGTGRPSVVPCERLHPWTEIVKYPGFETFDQIIAAELKLYIHLYEAIYHTVSSVPEAWEMVNRWGRKYLGEGNNVLRWAHSCVSLILSRWELAKQNQVMSPDSLMRNERINELTQTVIRHAQLVLREILVLCTAETAFVRPTYDYLLTAYAGVTLAEYCSSISDVHATYTLMEDVRTQARIPRSIEGVFSWATNVVQKKAKDFLDSKVAVVPDDTFYSYPGSVADWAPFRFIDSMPASDWDGMNGSMQQF
ncbi:transcriptional regulator family: Fungal Specific TF, partial [Penicillium coprophilum]|uniref:transcriptional regulator family: Fungal Specific TF n=1 Tax=Penicillium coprophilum TaxID=36646 RepID=UPI00238D13EC